MTNEMLGTLKEVMDGMEKGIFNFCKDGKCVGCGQCCSALLPMSEKEIADIKRYVKKKHISVVSHVAPLSRGFDLLCPFLDTAKDCDKCKVYPVRPRICREFKCDTPPSKVRKNKELFYKTRMSVNLWDVDWNA